MKKHLGMGWNILCILVVLVFASLSISTADQDFDTEFNKANTSEQLEILLKKYNYENERIIPKLESIMIEEIKKRGVGNRFLIKDIEPTSDDCGSITIEEMTSGVMQLST